MNPADRSRLGRLRLASQRISRPETASAAGVVRWMTALQAQDFAGAKWSVALRTPDLAAADIDAALDRGEFVRSWPFRGTLHFVPGEDLEWMLDLTAARTIAGAATRHRGLGLDSPTFEKARGIAETVLAGRRALTRDDLFAAFRAGGVSTEGQRGAHLLWYLSHTKTLCFGPMIGKAQALVLLAEWVEHPRRPERDEALGELAARYFRSHGPATLKDFLWWSKLLVPHAKTGLELAQAGLESIEVDGTTYWLAAGALDADVPAARASPRASSDVFLLPGFDEYLLGYTDRSAVLDPEHFERIVPGGNGMFLATIVAGGRVVGTWSRAVTARKVTLKLDPFAGLTTDEKRGAATSAQRYADYLGLRLDLAET